MRLSPDPHMPLFECLLGTILSSTCKDRQRHVNGMKTGAILLLQVALQGKIFVHLVVEWGFHIILLQAGDFLYREGLKLRTPHIHCCNSLSVTIELNLHVGKSLCNVKKNDFLSTVYAIRWLNGASVYTLIDCFLCGKTT